MSEKRFCKISLYLSITYICILSYIGYLYIYFNINKDLDYSKTIFIFSWLGIFLGIYIIRTWYKLTGTFISLYIIFMLFFFLFNYGQPIMWALGIHKTNEIGKVGLYTLGVANTADILLSQEITLISILFFHFGAMYCYKGRKLKRKNTVDIDINNNSIITRIAIYKTSFCVSFLVTPIAFYNLIYKLIVSQLYGYRAFYYNKEIVTNIVAFNLIDNMFFPCLIGLLIGSNYVKEVRVYVYVTFGAYMMISLLSGDRGDWIFKLIILVWMSHTYYKKIDFKKSLKYILSGLLGLQILDAIVSVRNIGINIKNIVQSFSINESALVSAIFEMGSSMRPTIVLMKYGWDIWPYGNTYINALLGIISSRFITLIGRPWAPLSDWFSQSYLGISYGAGFSIVAEALINFGPIFAPVFMIILGYIISSITYLDKNLKIEYNPLKIFFAISTMESFISIARNHFLWIVKSWFYGVFLFIILIIFTREYIKGKNKFVKKVINEA